jgi:hypothetical protein
MAAPTKPIVRPNLQTLETSLRFTIHSEDEGTIVCHRKVTHGSLTLKTRTSRKLQRSRSMVLTHIVAGDVFAKPRRRPYGCAWNYVSRNVDEIPTDLQLLDFSFFYNYSCSAYLFRQRHIVLVSHFPGIIFCGATFRHHGIDRPFAKRQNLWTGDNGTTLF